VVDEVEAFEAVEKVMGVSSGGGQGAVSVLSRVLGRCQGATGSCLEAGAAKTSSFSSVNLTVFLGVS
jgi:hypothetical protein